MAYANDSRYVNAVLLEGATGITDGVWFEIRTAEPLFVSIEGTFVAEVAIHVSYRPIKIGPPANNDNNRPILSAPTTSPRVIQFNGPVNYIKARVSAYTSGTIEVYVFGGSGPVRVAP